MPILHFCEGIYYCEYDLNQYSTFPQLDAIQFIKMKYFFKICQLLTMHKRKNSQCYDIALMGSLVIIQCSDTNQDYFSILPINQISLDYLTIEKPNFSFSKINMIDQYLIGNTIYKLELYEEKDLGLQFINSLDQNAFRTLLQTKKHSNYKQKISKLIQMYNE
ncbi:unnamed protein product [Paramecium sonneborni]|uniref:Uncharacterized protein n=1 Tax=Paramecium sonneborni TaxID=65129 RepID=A0A8S1QY46_9CILI|nr:unnamed protein product [Paramecium sonneborni]